MLYVDLEIDLFYNIYKYVGIFFGFIVMFDIFVIDVVLYLESYDYYYFVVNVKNFGYYKFVKILV